MTNDKYLNYAFIGNSKLVTSLSKNGEILRACFPFVDGKQFFEFFKCGVKINDSAIIYLHDDINNKYSQEYIENTNVLITKIENTYFNVKFTQTDFVSVKNDVIIRKYEIENNNSIDLNIDFLIDSKILSTSIENFGSRATENGIVQYNHDYIVATWSNQNIKSHKLNDVQNQIWSGEISDKDYIGMSSESAVSYSIGNIKSNEKKEFEIYIKIEKNDDEKNILNCCGKMNSQEELKSCIKFWKNYVNVHHKIKQKLEPNTERIYNRTILLFSLLVNESSGGVSAAMDVDEKHEKSGGYGYSWPRDAIFITSAFDLLGMEDYTQNFYEKFCKMTQSDNGMWEQRFFTDGKLAPCWGYQIDETASVIFGIFKHYQVTKNQDFLHRNLKMCEKGIEFLCSYVEAILGIEEQDIVKKEIEETYNTKFDLSKHISYDLWEMNEGIHLYSLSSIIAAFDSIEKMYEVSELKMDPGYRLKNEKRNNLLLRTNKLKVLLKEYIDKNLINDSQIVFKRNIYDNVTDVSVIGAVYPFEIFDIDEKVVKNTVNKIDMILRTYSNGYLRFEGDNYLGGRNPWIITTLWMAMYFIKSGDVEKAKNCFEFVVKTASEHGFLSEQVSNEDPDFRWVNGLGWSHAMFIIVLEEIMKYNK